MARELSTEKAIKKALRMLTPDEKIRLIEAQDNDDPYFYELLNPFVAGHCILNCNTIRGGIVWAIRSGCDTIEKYEEMMMYSDYE